MKGSFKDLCKLLIVGAFSVKMSQSLVGSSNTDAKMSEDGLQHGWWQQSRDSCGAIYLRDIPSHSAHITS